MKGGCTVEKSAKKKGRTSPIGQLQGLTSKQLEAVELLLNGEYNKGEIAEIVGVHRNTITQWCKNDEFVAALKEREAEKNRQTLALLKSKSTRATEILMELAECSDKRVQMEAVKYILDRNLGKTTAKVEIDDTRKTNEDYDLQAALERIKEDSTPISSDFDTEDNTEE